MKDNQHNINKEIKAKKVKLIDGQTGDMLGDFSFEEAINKAKSKNLDLMELKNDNGYAICKMLDYGKFLYQQKKKKKNKENKPKVLKEIKLRPVTAEADLNTKINHIKDFTESGHPVKITIVLKGRERGMLPNAKVLMQNILEQLKEVSKIKKECYGRRKRSFSIY